MFTQLWMMINFMSKGGHNNARHQMITFWLRDIGLNQRQFSDDYSTPDENEGARKNTSFSLTHGQAVKRKYYTGSMTILFKNK